jgi:hypothetical protein
MITEGIPAVIFGAFKNGGTDGIKIDIGQAIDQGLSVFNDNALEPFTPKGYRVDYAADYSTRKMPVLSLSYSLPDLTIYLDNWQSVHQLPQNSLHSGLCIVSVSLHL